jgi:hypothetical protein
MYVHTSSIWCDPFPFPFPAGDIKNCYNTKYTFSRHHHWASVMTDTIMTRRRRRSYVPAGWGAGFLPTAAAAAALAAVAAAAAAEA